VSELFVVGVSGGKPVTLLRGRDVSSPRWQSDGRTLDYLATAADGSIQLFARDATGREHALTHAAGDVVDYAWRPGADEFAYAANDVPADAAVLRDYGGTKKAALLAAMVFTAQARARGRRQDR